MRILTAKTPPSAKELAGVLKRELSDQYSYRLFGLGEKSLIVGKSRFVGAQISVKGNEITVQAAPPSIIGSLLAAAGLTELGVVLLPLFLLDGNPLPFGFGDLEKEIGVFLKHKYS